MYDVLSTPQPVLVYQPKSTPNVSCIYRWQNFELISDRPFDVMIKEMKRLKVRRPSRVALNWQSSGYPAALTNLKHVPVVEGRLYYTSGTQSAPNHAD